jgi:DNA-binding IclR family transcriptional regulator
VAATVGADRLDVDAALVDIARARDDGYLVGRGRRERGIVGIAAAVPGRDGRAAAGITVSAPAQRTDRARRDEIIEALLVGAADLAAAVGRA